MFKRSFRSNDRVEKAVKSKKSYRDPAKLSKLQRSFNQSPPVGGYVADAWCNARGKWKLIKLQQDSDLADRNIYGW
jgi:hypothetical protein